MPRRSGAIAAAIVSPSPGKADRRGEQAREHPLDRARLDPRRAADPGAISKAIRGAALGGDPLVGFVQPAQQGDGVDRALVELEPPGLDPRRGVEIVDRGEQAPRLLHDVGGAAAIGGRGRAHILALDHLGEADDRVQRRAQLVDQLAQRIGRELGAEQAGGAGSARWRAISSSRGRRAVPR